VLSSRPGVDHPDALGEGRRRIIENDQDPSSRRMARQEGVFEQVVDSRIVSDPDEVVA
jgi:hypothetical protein